jgi:hypothetical protein
MLIVLLCSKDTFSLTLNDNYSMFWETITLTSERAKSFGIKTESEKDDQGNVEIKPELIK